MYSSTTDLIRAFRSEMHDAVVPYLWSDEDLYEYMTEGELVVAQRTLCLQDMTSAATLYTVAADAADVVLHPSVYRIRGAWWVDADGGEFRLDIVSVDQMLAEGFKIHTQAGRPNAIMTGAVTNGVRLYPIPQEAGELRVSVYRTPLAPLTAETTFEIPIQYRSALLSWMRHRGYKKDDAEAFNREGSNSALRTFEYQLDQYTTSESMRRGSPQNGVTGYGGL